MKKVKYDPSEDAAYIYIQSPEDLEWKVIDTYCCDYNEVGWMINIDFDRDNKIVWIELIPASRYLTKEFLSQFMN